MERGDKITAFQVIRGDQGNYVLIDPVSIAGIIEGRSSFSAKSMTRALMSEEIAHIAALENLDTEEVLQVYQEMSDATIQNTVNKYYQKNSDREAARTRLASDNEVESQKESFIIAQEFLRMEAQKVIRGYTTEQDIAFYRNNKGIVSTIIRYFKSLISKLSNNLKSDKNNPYLSMSVNRVVSMYNQMRKGFKPDALKSFNPLSPLENLVTLQSQVNLEQEEPFDSLTGLKDSVI
mgnify:CR=1 FL=1